MTTPLDGIRVVEMTSVVLGPYACQMLGDLGADVIKIEPPAGDTNRNLGPHRNHRDMCSMYLGCNRNKRSVALDLKSERGRQAALDIMQSADVVVHNFRPQAMARLGLDYAAIRAVNPEVVYCATYGYSKDKRPDLKQFLVSMLCVDRNIPILGTTTDGNASDKTLNNELLTNISRYMAEHGLKPGDRPGTDLYPRVWTRV